MLLSVIIPVYNVEHTLRRCVDSVLSQSVSDMELILVDDGSTDNSPRIADSYACADRVKVVHQQNGGLSEARNTGLGIATGQYVTFVDSDDYLAANTYAPLISLLSDNPQYDILEYSVSRETPHGVMAIDFPEREYTDMRSYWTEGKAYAHTYAWNKIYRRTLFDEVSFPHRRDFEDVYALTDLLKLCRCLRTTAHGCYHYTLNSDGITMTAGAGSWRDLLEAHMRVIADSKLRDYSGFADYYYQILNIQLQTYALSGHAADIRLPRMSYAHNWKLRLLQLLGMKNLCRLYRTVYRLIKAHRL